MGGKACGKMPRGDEGSRFSAGEWRDTHDDDAEPEVRREVRVLEIESRADGIVLAHGPEGPHFSDAGAMPQHTAMLRVRT